MVIRQFLKRKASEDVSTLAARSGSSSAKQSDNNVTNICAVELSSGTSVQFSSPHRSREARFQSPTTSGDFAKNVETFPLSAEENVQESHSLNERHTGTSNCVQESASDNLSRNENESLQTKDIGCFMHNQQHRLTASQKYQLLTDHFRPSATYNFNEDKPCNSNRAFRHVWLEEYSPWLAYSPTLKGAVCIYCILFPRPVQRGLQGGFIIRPFTNYRKFHEYAKKHSKSAWHCGAQMQASEFAAIQKRQKKDVLCQLNESVNTTVERNRQKLFPIVSSLLFCAMNDIATRGKQSDGGNFQELLRFRVEAGDKILEEHFATSAQNARYTSHRVQNDLIGTFETVLPKDLTNAINQSKCFALLADETTDIFGKEQLSIGIRYLDSNSILCEEFLGFFELGDRTAAGIANTLLKACNELGVDMSKLIGQGYDGCSAMTGMLNGVQAKIREIYPKALYVHCSAHRLNLVVNDLNSVQTIRNTTSTIKSIVSYFRESLRRRALVPNLPLLSETRWTSKYKSIRKFKENFSAILNALNELVNSNHSDTRQGAYQFL